MVFGIDDALMAAGIQAAGSALGGYLSGSGSAQQETKMQRTQRKLVDQLISSLGGEGQFANLYDSNPDVFQKSFVQPAQALFRNQIAPQIQQQFIAGGQQRGTGLDDQLLRAGVDLDSMLNQHMYQFNQDALNRKQNTIGSILGGGAGAPNQTSAGQDVMSGLGGYLSSSGFANTTADMFKKPQLSQPNPYTSDFRKGFES